MNREEKLGREYIACAVHNLSASVLQGIHKAAFEKTSHLNMEKTVKIAKDYLSLPRHNCTNFRDCIPYSQLYQMKPKYVNPWEQVWDTLVFCTIEPPTDQHSRYQQHRLCTTELESSTFDKLVPYIFHHHSCQ